MYPTTTVKWHDVSGISRTTDIETVDNLPLYCQAASFDRGPEDMRIISGARFYELYGNKMNFAKHGQPALQIANIIDGGGSILLKRVVAEDALLANVVLCANVTKKRFAKVTTSSDGISYAQAVEELTGSSTTVGDNDKSYTIEENSNTLTVKWTALSITGCKTHAEVAEEAAALYSEGTYEVTADESGNLTATMVSVYPILTVSENGRGVSTKRVKFSPDTSSRDVNNMFYAINIFDGTTRLQKITGSFNIHTIINNVSYGLSNETSEQVIFEIHEDSYNKYFADVLDVCPNHTEETLKKDDIIFGTTNRGSALSARFTLDPESVDLNSTYGVELQNGDNGEFGDAPFGTAAYTDALVSFYSGEADDSIWDIDQFKVCAVFDANYPIEVKTAIANFVSFREDCVFFRDLGTEVFSYASIVSKLTDIKLAAAADPDKAKFICDYLTTYQIYDPETKRRIRVTMMYDFARAMISHFATAPQKPIAGVINGMVLANAIDGTLNFTPRVTPAVNQKSLIDDLRVNYAIFQEGQCAIQSLYTSQDAYTQLSYANNVLAIQDVVRTVRSACPRQRYTFVDSNDFSDYAQAVNNVLKEYTNSFDELKFEYAQDDLQAAQKLFYATIYFRFKNWAQAEHFDVYALPTTSGAEEE